MKTLQNFSKNIQDAGKMLLRSFRRDENSSYQKVVEWYDINAKDILDIINQNGHAEDAEKTDIGKNWKREMTEKKNMDSFNLVNQEIKMDDVVQRDTEEVFLTSLEQDVEKVILREDAMEKYLEVTCQDHKVCWKCKILKTKDFITEQKKYDSMWEACRRERQSDGTYKIIVKYQFRKEPFEMFPVSNVKAAYKNAKRVALKAEKDGITDILEDEVRNRVKRGILTELNEEEIENLNSKPHNFCNYSIVKNERSLTTKYRLVSNSSTMNCGKSVSTQEVVPKQSLNSLTSCIFGFLFLPVALISDITKAYEAILTDERDGDLRLMATSFKSDNYKLRVFKKNSLLFGDRSSATFLEIGILKFVVNECKLEATKTLLKSYRYSDNISTSFVSEKEFTDVKRDLIQAFSKYNLQLKFVIKNVNTTEEDTHEIVQPLFGFNWNRGDDTISNNLKLNPAGYKKGLRQGKDLVDMSNDEIDNLEITRGTMLRISGQLFKNLEWLYGCCSFTWKILTSMILEITQPSELNDNIEHKDKKLCKIIKETLKDLRHVNQIKKIERPWVSKGECLYGFLICSDGSKSGYASIIYALTNNGLGGGWKSRIATCKSKLSKRNVVINEAISRLLGNNLMESILDAIGEKLKKLQQKVVIYHLGDSVSALFALHEGAKLSNTMLVNISRKFYQSSKSIVNKVGYETKMNVGYVESSLNSADLISKFMRNSVEKCNSALYRNGPQLSIAELEERTVIEYIGGHEPVFDANKLMALANQEKNMARNLRENVNENVMMTRAQYKQWNEAAKEKSPNISVGTKGFVPLGLFGDFKLLEIKNNIKIALNKRSNVLGKGFESKLTLDLADKMNHWTAHFYSFESVTTLFWLIVRMSHVANESQPEPVEACFDSTLNEALCLMFRTTQNLYKPDSGEGCFDENLKLTVVKPRIKLGHCLRTFGTDRLVEIGANDPMKYKLIRWKHEIMCCTNFNGHRTQRQTLAAVLSAPVGVYWKNMKSDVRKYCRACGICAMQRPLKAKCSMGKSLLRDVSNRFGFSDVSIDPLGGLMVTWCKRAQMVYPIIIQCITTKCIHLGLMPNMQTESV